jgi:hypothetical protein
LGRKPKQAIVDLGYRGVDADNPGVQIIHRVAGDNYLERSATTIVSG